MCISCAINHVRADWIFAKSFFLSFRPSFIITVIFFFTHIWLWTRRVRTFRFENVYLLYYSFCFWYCATVVVWHISDIIHICVHRRCTMLKPNWQLTLMSQCLLAANHKRLLNNMPCMRCESMKTTIITLSLLSRTSLALKIVFRCWANNLYHDAF